MLEHLFIGSSHNLKKHETEQVSGPNGYKLCLEVAFYQVCFYGILELQNVIQCRGLQRENSKRIELREVNKH